MGILYLPSCARETIREIVLSDVTCKPILYAAVKVGLKLLLKRIGPKLNTSWSMLFLAALSSSRSNSWLDLCEKTTFVSSQWVGGLHGILYFENLGGFQ